MRVLRTTVLVVLAAAATASCGLKAPKLPKMPRMVLNDPADRDMNNPAWQEHVRKCTEKHPGYDPLTNMYPDTRGRMSLC